MPTLQMYPNLNLKYVGVGAGKGHYCLTAQKVNAHIAYFLIQIRVDSSINGYMDISYVGSKVAANVSPAGFLSWKNLPEEISEEYLDSLRQVAAFCLREEIWKKRP